jgi:hypothetical protein
LHFGIAGPRDGAAAQHNGSAGKATGFNLLSAAVADDRAYRFTA